MSFYVGPFCRFIFLTSKLNAGGYNLSFKIELVSSWSFEIFGVAPPFEIAPLYLIRGKRVWLARLQVATGSGYGT